MQKPEQTRERTSPAAADKEASPQDADRGSSMV